MRLFKKRLLAAALGLATLAACSSNAKIHVLEDSNTQPVYLSFFSSQSMSDKDVSKYWVNCFQEKYNKQVYINFDSAVYYADKGLSYRELLEKRLESSAPDDLYIINAEDVLEFDKKGYWMDLSGMDFVQNLSDAALYQSTYNGKVFSVPLSFTGFGFAWNVDMLKQYGLTVPQNMQEFLLACEKLKSYGVLPYGANKGYALTVPAMCVGLSSLYGSENIGDKIESLNNGQTAISSYMKDGFEFLYLMCDKGYLNPKQAIEATPKKEDFELFLSGNCAFVCAGLSDYTALIKTGFDVELTGLPVLPSGNIAVYGANDRLCVNPKSKHLNTVLEFIEMIATPEALAKNAELNGTMSSAKDSETDGFSKKLPISALLQQPGQIPNQDFALYFNTWESIRDVCRELIKGADIETACALLDEKQQQELKEYRVLNQ